MVGATTGAVRQSCGSRACAFSSHVSCATRSSVQGRAFSSPRFCCRTCRLLPTWRAHASAQSPTRGAFVCGPIASLVAALVFPANVPLAIGIIWCAHIGFDRALGYGLKYQANPSIERTDAHVER